MLGSSTRSAVTHRPHYSEMRIGIISESPTDLALASALLNRVAASRAGVQWPLQTDNTVERIGIRQGGHGQVLKALKKLKKLLNDSPFSDYSLILVLVDRVPAALRKHFTKEVRGDDRFVLGIAIKEIEAWWLADRLNVLAWLQLTNEDIEDHRYGAPQYNSEQDEDPKCTLDEITNTSTAVGTRYGGGNLGLAREFSLLWKDSARLGQMELHCPEGFAPFCRDAER